jgi:hypothetical protein
MVIARRLVQFRNTITRRLASVARQTVTSVLVELRQADEKTHLSFGDFLSTKKQLFSPDRRRNCSWWWFQ